MGLGGISIWQMLIILVIVLLLFGTKKLRNIGSDLGSAVKGFKKSVADDKPADDTENDVQTKEQIASKDADFDASQAQQETSKTKDQA